VRHDYFVLCRPSIQATPWPTSPLPSPPFLHTVALFSDNDLTDVVRRDMTDIKSVQPVYVATYRDVQTAADITGGQQ